MCMYSIDGLKDNVNKLLNKEEKQQKHQYSSDRHIISKTPQNKTKRPAIENSIQLNSIPSKDGLITSRCGKLKLTNKQKIQQQGQKDIQHFDGGGV